MCEILMTKIYRDHSFVVVLVFFMCRYCGEIPYYGLYHICVGSKYFGSRKFMVLEFRDGRIAGQPLMVFSVAIESWVANKELNFFIVLNFSIGMKENTRALKFKYHNYVIVLFSAMISIANCALMDIELVHDMGLWSSRGCYQACISCKV